MKVNWVKTLRFELGVEYSQAMPKMHQRARDWLAHHAIPLWLEKGVDRKGGGFTESLTLNGDPMDLPKRTMVQARQIYSFRLAANLGCMRSETLGDVISHGVNYLLGPCSLPSGAFVHSVGGDGKPHKTTPDLYAQAFGLFGLAHAYGLTPEKGIPKERIKERAQALLSYLRKERRAPHGGYFELSDTGPAYESNPLMHLFEAVLSWMDVDQDASWREVADEIADLALHRFIDPRSGALAERFDSNWKPLLDQGRFVIEPGHQYEWAWLFGRYQNHTGRNVQAARLRLFELSEQNGLCSKRRTAYDELWSDLSCKTSTSRFWPQCERAKIAVQLGVEAPESEQKRYHDAADEAIAALFRFFETEKQGLWFDRCNESSEFAAQPAKASSLYHIIGAIHEYLQGRPS